MGTGTGARNNSRAQTHKRRTIEYVKKDGLRIGFSILTLPIP